MTNAIRKRVRYERDLPLVAYGMSHDTKVGLGTINTEVSYEKFTET